MRCQTALRQNICHWQIVSLWSRPQRRRRAHIIEQGGQNYLIMLEKRLWGISKGGRVYRISSNGHNASNGCYIAKFVQGEFTKYARIVLTN